MLKKKKCKWCKNNFMPRTPLQMFDFPECLFAYNKENTRKKTMREKEKNFKILEEAKLEDKLRNRADKLFQEVGILLNPRSLLSLENTQVIHHYINKAHSNNLRYDFENGIPLTNDQHGSVHAHRKEEVMNQIAAIKGEKWLRILEEKRRITCKLTIPYLKQKVEELEQLKRELS